MVRHHIPTAKYATFTDAAAAHAYNEREGAPIVVKADGLAAGKGVVVAQSKDEAHAAIDMMLAPDGQPGAFGEAGAQVVIEECLQGEEASFIVMVDGEHVLPMATSQDHKRLLDNDQGPNTGGMGAYSPAPVVTPELHARILREVIRPVVAGMKAEDTPYTGFLYAGVMIAPDGKIGVLEFNCRFGDPETQPIMMRLKSDFTVLLEAAVNGKLDQVEAEWDRRVALGVVLAAGGYPDSPRKGDAIIGLDIKVDGDCHVFHAGTAIKDDQVVVSGGRVLCVTALGDTVKIAQANAYDVADRIEFAGRQMRRDIGWRAIKKR
jgi:phosphoribosylamine--glycine ligase